MLIRTLQNKKEESNKNLNQVCTDNDALVSRPAITLTILRIRAETEKDQARQRAKKKCDLLPLRDV